MVRVFFALIALFFFDRCVSIALETLGMERGWLVTGVSAAVGAFMAMVVLGERERQP